MTIIIGDYKTERNRGDVVFNKDEILKNPEKIANYINSYLAIHSDIKVILSTDSQLNDNINFIVSKSNLNRRHTAYVMYQTQFINDVPMFTDICTNLLAKCNVELLHNYDHPIIANRDEDLFINLRIDPRSLPETEFVKPAIHIPRELANEVINFGVIAEKYWYWDEEGASRYISITNSNDYSVLEETHKSLAKNLHYIIEQIKRWSGRTDLSSIETIILGVGSARKEIELLKVLASDERKVRCALIDVSFPLLESSLRVIYSDPTLQNKIRPGQLNVEPFLSDFTTIDRNDVISDRNSQIKLIVALGVLWNLPFLDAFDVFNRLLNDDPTTYLLLDIEFVDNRTEQEIIKEYSSHDVYKFLYHPLELLYKAADNNYDNTFVWYHKKIGQESQQRLGSHPTSRRYKDYFGSYEKDFDKYKVEIIYQGDDNNKYNKLVRRYRLNPFAKNYIKLDEGLGGSKTVLCIYDNPRGEIGSIILGYSTRYNRKNFEQYLNENGFEYRAFNGDKSIRVVYLIRKQNVL